MQLTMRIALILSSQVVAFAITEGVDAHQGRTHSIVQADGSIVEHKARNMDAIIRTEGKDEKHDSGRRSVVVGVQGQLLPDDSAEFHTAPVSLQEEHAVYTARRNPPPVEEGGDDNEHGGEPEQIPGHAGGNNAENNENHEEETGERKKRRKKPKKVKGEKEKHEEKIVHVDKLGHADGDADADDEEDEDEKAAGEGNTVEVEAAGRLGAEATAATAAAEEEKPPVKCEWNDWNDWSACTTTCGGGDRVRQRSRKLYPERGGDECIEPHQQSGSCSNNPCEIAANMEDCTHDENAPVAIEQDGKMVTTTCAAAKELCLEAFGKNRRRTPSGTQLFQHCPGTCKLYAIGLKHHITSDENLVDVCEDREDICECRVAINDDEQRNLPERTLAKIETEADAPIGMILLGIFVGLLLLAFCGTFLASAYYSHKKRKDAEALGEGEEHLTGEVYGGEDYYAGYDEYGGEHGQSW